MTDLTMTDLIKARMVAVEHDRQARVLFVASEFEQAREQARLATKAWELVSELEQEAA